MCVHIPRLNSGIIAVTMISVKHVQSDLFRIMNSFPLRWVKVVPKGIVCDMKVSKSIAIVCESIAIVRRD